MRDICVLVAMSCLLVTGAGSQQATAGEQQELFRILPLFQQGQYDRAEQELKSALERYPRSALLHNALGILYRKTNQTAEAIASFEDAVRELPSFTAAQLQLASLYQQQGKSKRAADLFVAAGEGTTNAEAMSEAALGAAECGDSVRAIPLFQKARASGSESPSLLYNLALAQHNIGDDQAALATLASLPSPAPPQADIAYLRGKVRQGLHDPAAREDLAHACRLDARNSDYCSSAATELARQERFNGALEAIEAGLAISPRSETLLSLHGLVLFRLGRYAEAAASYSKVLELNPRLDAAREGLAFLLFITGELEKAKSVVESALHEPGADFYLYQLHAMILNRLSPELRDAAMVSVNQAIQRNSSFAPSYFLRGKLKLEAKDLKGAEEDFQTSARLDPKFSLPHYKLAQIYYRLGKLREAEAEEKLLSTLGNMREEEILARQTQDLVLSAGH